MSCGNSRSSKCNPCGPSEAALNEIANKAAYYARIAQFASDGFSQVYLGAKDVAPTTDNNGLPLQEGALYFNTVSNILFVWDGSNWLSIYDDEIYLGGFAVAPTLNNQGLPLQLGNLYWNTGSNNLWAYNGTTWIITNFNETTPFLSTGSTTARTLANRFADVVNVKDFGAVGDGVTDDTAAMLAAEAAGESVYFPEGNYKVTVVPKLGVSWGIGKVFISGIQTYLHPTTGPVNEVFVSVFGPNNTATADAYAELQRAIDFAQSVDLPLTLEQNAKYAIGTGLTFKHGRSLSDTKGYNVYLNGNYSTFYTTSVINTISIVPRCLIANAGTGAGIANISIRDINFSGFGNPTSKALVIGLSGYACDNFAFSKIENIVCVDFNSNAAIYLIECRHINFDRVVVRGSTFRIEASASGSFCGDHVFQTCEFVASATQNNLAVNAGGALNTNAQVRGINFQSCDFYGSQTELVSNGTVSQVGDFWFIGCQWDQGTGRAVYVAAQNAGQVFGIHFVDPYFAGFLNGGLYFTTGGSGQMAQIFVTNGQFGIISGANPIIAIGGPSNIEINNCSFGNCTSSECIGMNNCTNVSINNNTSFLCTTTYGVSVGGASMNNYSIIGNLMNAITSAVNDYTVGTPTKQVVNNLKT